MAIALVIIGAIFIVAAIRGTHEDLFAIMQDDFGGRDSFLTWGIAIFFIGLIGYSKSMRPLSNSFLVLLFVVILLSNQGFFNKFMSQIRS